MKWVIFHHEAVRNLHSGAGDRVKYLVPGLDKPKAMQLKKFISFLFQNFKVRDWYKIEQALNSFQTICVYDSGEYEFYSSFVEVPFLTLTQKMRIDEKEMKEAGSSDSSIIKTKVFEYTNKLKGIFQHDTRNRSQPVRGTQLRPNRLGSRR